MTEEKPISEIEKELCEVLRAGARECECGIMRRKYEICDHCGQVRKGIMLNDVLLKIMESGQHYNFYPSIEDAGILVLRVWEKTPHFTVVHYDLTKSFDNLPEETKRKLHKLLCSPDTK